MATETEKPEQHDFSAFPHAGPDRCYDRGMSLRDWFAGQNMAAILNDDGWGSFERKAAIAYEAADALLSARNGEPSQ